MILAHMYIYIYNVCVCGIVQNLYILLIDYHKIIVLACFFVNVI